MGERDVVAGDPPLERHQVVGAFVVQPAGPPVLLAGGEAGELHVHVVGGAPHQPDRRLRQARQPTHPAAQIVDRRREHVTDVDRLAGLGIRDQTVGGELMLAVEHTSQRARRPLELRMGRRIVDHVTLEVDAA